MTINLLIMTAVAFAHRPTFGDHTSIDEAYLVDDPSISMVLYHELTCDAEQLWLHFDAEAGTNLFLQLGVPELERLEGYQPAVALIAPGLPKLPPLPFDVPAGYGGYLFNSDDQPTAFYEPFTQTSSWIWVEESIPLVESGDAWVVGYHPGDQTGKLWVALGTIEDFSDVGVDDWDDWSQAVADFHESNGELQVTEEVCMDYDPAQDPEATATTGCTHLKATTGLGWSGLFTLGFLAWSRRQTKHFLPAMGLQSEKL